MAPTMVSISGALMAKKEVLEPFLALILRDDLLSWHMSKASVNRTEEQQKAVRDGAVREFFVFDFCFLDFLGSFGVLEYFRRWRLTGTVHANMHFLFCFLWGERLLALSRESCVSCVFVCVSVCLFWLCKPFVCAAQEVVDATRRPPPPHPPTNVFR